MFVNLTLSINEHRSDFVRILREHETKTLVIFGRADRTCPMNGKNKIKFTFDQHDNFEVIVHDGLGHQFLINHPKSEVQHDQFVLRNIQHFITRTQK